MLTLLCIILAIIYVIIGSIFGTIVILTYVASERKDIVELADLAYNHPNNLSDVTDEDDKQTAADVIGLGIVLGFVVLIWPIYMTYCLIATKEDKA